MRSAASWARSPMRSASSSACSIHRAARRSGRPGAVRQAAYRLKMREVLEWQPNLKIKQAEVADLILDPASGSGLRAWANPLEQTDYDDPDSRAEARQPKPEARVLGVKLAMAAPRARKPSSSPPAPSSTALFTAASSSIPRGAPGNRMRTPRRSSEEARPARLPAEDRNAAAA